MIFRTAIIATFIGTASITIAAAEEPCFDYTEVLRLDLTSCTATSLIKTMKNAFRNVREGRCRGGFNHELMALTGTNSFDAARQTLQDMCDSALADAAEEAQSSAQTWQYLEEEPHKVDLVDFYEGNGHLNLETGNFQQKTSDFEKRGGHERFLYIGEDPRFNDHYPTTDSSFYGGEKVSEFYDNNVKKSFLSAPTLGFEKGCQSNTAICCWHRDRQYLDKNGNCGFTDCANQNPSDNTDLCWTEENGTVFPYPGDEIENDLHCHGFAWGENDNDGGVDINTNARWNNLFFVSMYDHMYQRGYVESITNDPKIAGDQAMCGCVEEMAPVARADCTEAIGQSNYTSHIDPDTNTLVVQHVPGSFELEFKSCRGYDYVPDFSPKDYQLDPDAEELESSNNDLAAFVFRQYLEGKMEEKHVELVEETIIGYRNPKVNNNDEEREKACAAAFAERFENEPYEEREMETTLAE
eukprot:jgi/Psemu1/289055/fgenesh1_pg.311_\